MAKAGPFPWEAWKRYAKLQADIQQAAADKMAGYIEEFGLKDRTGAMQYAYWAIGEKYGPAAAEAACEMYDLTARMAGVSVPPAEPAEMPTPEQVTRFVEKAAAQSDANIPAAVGNMVKRAGADTTLKNAARDGAEWAWVPVGDTCAFCRMLASQGWQRQSKKAQARHAEHIHNHCDCQYAVRFNGQGGPAGYDPEKYAREYYDADEGSWQDKVNAMRRADYAENADEINAQKRAAYAARQEDAARRERKKEQKQIEKAEQKPSTLTGVTQSDILGLDKAIGKQVNGTTIQWLSTHLQTRMEERHVSADDVLDAINHPLNIKPVTYDSEGRPSFVVIGEKATFALNPENGVLTTTWKTGSKLAKRLKEGNNS